MDCGSTLRRRRLPRLAPALAVSAGLHLLLLLALQPDRQPATPAAHANLLPYEAASFTVALERPGTVPAGPSGDAVSNRVQTSGVPADHEAVPPIRSGTGLQGGATGGGDDCRVQGFRFCSS